MQEVNYFFINFDSLSVLLNIWIWCTYVTRLLIAATFVVPWSQVVATKLLVDLSLH